MAAIFGKRNIFDIRLNYSEEIPYGSKILMKSLYLARFSTYKHICVLAGDARYVAHHLSCGAEFIGIA